MPAPAPAADRGQDLAASRKAVAAAQADVAAFRPSTGERAWVRIGPNRWRNRGTGEVKVSAGNPGVPPGVRAARRAIHGAIREAIASPDGNVWAAVTATRGMARPVASGSPAATREVAARVSRAGFAL